MYNATVGKKLSETHLYETRTTTYEFPKVVGLRSFPGVRSGSNRYIDGSYIVFLDKRNPDHINKLIDFVNTLNENTKEETRK